MGLKYRNPSKKEKYNAIYNKERYSKFYQIKICIREGIDLRVSRYNKVAVNIRIYFAQLYLQE